MKVWVDPPSGWKFGFPKIWDQVANPDFDAWLIAEGYPWSLKESFGPNFYVRQWNVSGDDEVQLLNEGR